MKRVKHQHVNSAKMPGYQTPETVDHILFDCNHFKDQRTSFEDYCLRILKSWPPSFATITSDKKLWCEMTKYVHQTKHFILPSPQ